ncbi:hypothetical protein MSG28_015790 [Choristoneura fumiferana]|uniref:Uncharacterized protein n=1 Tax=Choristoneura fumiferana TaxID=7141 RepID=A0ACC0KBK9_CHOFU|nr:hypothetical protein MSG28_015790 [Choristoneura fumiferana]
MDLYYKMSAKTSARPVHEVINEQARIDDKVKVSSPGHLPYGNPLAGNSQQNAKLHAQNQQAMFNAERVRQHRAQLQRWTKAPIRMDSYMKAYHESQESHQLAVEQQQAGASVAKVASTTPKTRRQERREKKVERDSPRPTLAQQYDYTKYAQIPHYASGYIPEPAKDHKPITEEVDDIEDPNKINKLRTYAPQAVQTQALQETQDTTTTKSNNYYKVEVASQTISTGHKAQYKEPDYYVNEDPAQPSYANYQALQYAPIPAHHGKDEGDQSERYLHHNAQHTGIQHLTGDGTGVSAYGDDSLHYAANYEFGYRVRDHKSGNDFGHQEAKSGGKTNGAYHVLLPDGRMQKVRYSAGPEGFHADISYDHLQ